MFSKSNSGRRFLAGLVLAALAMVFTGARQFKVSADNGAIPQQAPGLLATIGVLGAQLYAGGAQLASDFRSLYSLYELQSAPEILSATVRPSERNAGFGSPLDTDGAHLILCEILQPPQPAQKKKCRT